MYTLPREFYVDSWWKPPVNLILIGKEYRRRRGMTGSLVFSRAVLLLLPTLSLVHLSAYSTTSSFSLCSLPSSPCSYTPTSSSSSARRRIRAPSLGAVGAAGHGAGFADPFESSASLSLLASPSPSSGFGLGGGGNASPGGVGTAGGGSRFARGGGGGGLPGIGGGRGVSPGGGREAFGEELASEIRSMAFSTVAGVISTSDQVTVTHTHLTQTLQ